MPRSRVPPSESGDRSRRVRGAKKFRGILDIFEALRYRRERSKETITEHDRSVSS
jgi:hypothetical protein